MAVAKFNAQVEFTLETRMEPEGSLHSLRDELEHLDGVEEFEDQSYFSGQEVEADGGSFTFEITADDEDDARSQIEGAFFDGMEWEDDYSFTWVVSAVSVTLDEVEETLTVPEAVDVLGEMVDRFRDHEDAESKRYALAAEIVLGDHAIQGRRIEELSIAVRDLRSHVESLTSTVERLSARLKQVEGGSEEPTQVDPQ